MFRSEIKRHRRSDGDTGGEEEREEEIEGYSNIFGEIYRVMGEDRVFEGIERERRKDKR